MSDAERESMAVMVLVFGAEGQNRTGDTTIFSRMLYQLSYLGTADRSRAEP